MVEKHVLLETQKITYIIKEMQSQCYIWLPRKPESYRHNDVDSFH